MGGDDELGALQRHAMDVQQQGQLPLGRQRRLRLVHQVDALPAFILQEGEEALPVGLGVVVRHRPVVVFQICHGSDVEKALRAEEIARVALAIAPNQPNGLLQLGDVVVGAEVVIPRAALGVIAVGHGDALQQRGLARAVFPGKEGDIAVEGQSVEPLQGRDVTQVGVPWHLIPYNGRFPYEQRAPAHQIVCHLSLNLSPASGRRPSPSPAFSPRNG